MGEFPDGFSEMQSNVPGYRWLRLWYRDSGVTLSRYDIVWESKNYADDDPELLQTLAEKRAQLIANGFTIISTESTH